MIEAVTFDFWSTLVVEAQATTRRRRIDRWVEVLEHAGHRFTFEALDEAFHHTWTLFLDKWHANEIVFPADVTDAALRKIEVDVERAVRDELVEATANSADPDDLALTENLVPTLDRIVEAGIPIGIVCDVGLSPSTRLRHVLEVKGVLDRFTAWAFSDEVGCYKPDERIFQHALAGLGDPDPSRVAHIGDLRRTDIAGARNMGMLSVRYAGAHDDVGAETLEGHWTPEAHHVIDDHADLPAILGL